MIPAIFYGTYTVSTGRNMNDIESLRDYLIADEIQRIKLLTPEELKCELIAVMTARIESASADELLQIKYGTRNKN